MDDRNGTIDDVVARIGEATNDPQTNREEIIGYVASLRALADDLDDLDRPALTKVEDKRARAHLEGRCKFASNLFRWYAEMMEQRYVAGFADAHELFPTTREGSA